jgi:hypothetical protein
VSFVVARAAILFLRFSFSLYKFYILGKLSLFTKARKTYTSIIGVGSASFAYGGGLFTACEGMAAVRCAND